MSVAIFSCMLHRHCVVNKGALHEESSGGKKESFNNNVTNVPYWILEAIARIFSTSSKFHITFPLHWIQFRTKNILILYTWWFCNEYFEGNITLRNNKYVFPFFVLLFPSFFVWFFSTTITTNYLFHSNFDFPEALSRLLRWKC